MCVLVTVWLCMVLVVCVWLMSCLLLVYVLVPVVCACRFVCEVFVYELRIIGLCSCLLFVCYWLLMGASWFILGL